MKFSGTKENKSRKKHHSIYLIRPRWFSGDIVYKLIIKGDSIYFCRVGGQFYNIRDVDREYTEDTVLEKLAMDKYNFKTLIKSITSVKINGRKSAWTGGLTNNGTVTLTIGNRMYKYIIHLVQSTDEVINFFKDRGQIPVEAVNMREKNEESNKKRLRNRVLRRNPEYKNALRVTRIANALGYVLGLWALLYPRPYTFLMSANMLLPVAALFIYIRYKDYVEFDEIKGKTHPNIVIATVLPSMALVLRALNYNLIYSGMLWLYVFVIALFVYIVIIKKTEEYKRKKSVLLLVLIAILPYAFGVCVLSNCLFDFSEPVRYSAAVLDKRVNRGKSTSYYLMVEPWGPVYEEKEVDVTRKLYESIEKGDRIYLHLKKGALGIKWFIPQKTE